MGKWVREVIFFLMFLQKKSKAQGVFQRRSYTHKVCKKRGICKSGSHSIKFDKIKSRESLTESTRTTGQVIGIVCIVQSNLITQGIKH